MTETGNVAVEERTSPPGVRLTPGLELDELRMELRAGSTRFTLLDIPELRLEGGTTAGLAGPSGCGKTTLLNLCAGLLTPTAGRIRVDGIEMSALPQPQRDRLRAGRIGYVFQSFNLVPALTALENVLVAMGFSGRVRRPERRKRAQALLQRVGLAGRLHHRPADLSHGEMQRVGIARALANGPTLLLADEPTASLEPGLAESMIRLLLEVARETETTLLVASHDPRVLGMLGQVIELAQVNRAVRRAA
jgi:putative ABC transport system ATP-binding protein